MWEQLERKNKAEQLHVEASKLEQASREHLNNANGGDQDFWESIKLKAMAQSVRDAAGKII